MELDKNGKENTNRFSGLLISYLRSIGKWDGSNEYHFGDPQEEWEIGKAAANSLLQENFFSSPTESNGISFITRSSLLWNSKQKEAIEKGQLIHDLFAQINTGADVGTVLDNAENEGLFTSEEKEELKGSILSVTGHPELKRYFELGVVNYNERELISEDGSVLRPDRLNFSENNVSIIDYKTGASNNTHREQISEYGRQLEQMKYKVEKKILVYINQEIEVNYV